MGEIRGEITRPLIQLFQEETYPIINSLLAISTDSYTSHLQRIYMLLPGAHHKEPETVPYCYLGVFTDRSIFSLKLIRIEIPTGTSATNCNHMHGPMLTCQRDVDMFT